MEMITIGNLTKELRNPIFIACLKHHTYNIRICGKSRTALMPADENEPQDLTVVDSIPIKTFRGQIGYQIKLLRDRQFRDKTQNLAIALTNSESERMAYLVVSSELIKS
jgi:hypothetical protein